MAKFVFGAFLAALVTCSAMQAGVVKLAHTYESVKLECPGAPY